MAIRSKQFYVPLGDTALRGVNRFLATLEREQIRNVAATPKGRGTNIHVTYEDAVPPRLLSSSPSHNAWVRQGSFPSTMTLVFQNEVDPASIQDGTFRWVLLGSVEPVTASSVTVGEEGRLVSVPLPTAALSGYEGLLTLVGQDFASVDGAITRDRLQVGIQVTNGYIPREGDIPEFQSVPQGRMVLHRFYGHRVQLEHLLDNFVRGRRMDGQEMIQTVLLSHADQEEEAFVLWYEASHPRIASIQPQPGSNVPSEYGLEQITIAFSEPVSEYHLKGLDGYDRVLWNGSAFGGTFTQEDDVGAIWTLSDTGLLSTEGVRTLRLRDLRNTDGEPNGILAQYYWSVTPASVAGGTSDHGSLTGLADDDHLQYHTDARGDARYSALGHTHDGADVVSGTLDGDRLPGMSTTKQGSVPATGTPSGQYLRDDGTWDTPAGGSSDHGALTGLADDDHAQYALADGTRGDFETSGAVTGHESTYDHTKIHDQNTDQYLDQGGANQVTAAQAKAGYDHSQVTTGNPHSLDAGDVGADPAGTASGLVGTHESTYDHGKLHDQGTDQGLDTGGPNAVTAAQAKAGYDHSQVTTGNPHSLDAADVGADPAGTATTAVSNHEAAGDPHPGYALESALGTAAAADLGVGVGDVPALENVGGTPGLPAVDGSQLTGLPSGVSDHGALTGLGDDDHSQYHNDARGDARYYTQAQLNAGQLDSRYYTEAETDSAIDADVATHAAIADAHHARYADSEAVAAIKADAAWNATDWDTAFGWGDHAGLYDAAGSAAAAVSAHEGLSDPHIGYLLANGTRALSANWDAGSFQIRAETFQSDVATGTAPFTVASATLVNNLNADLLDGLQASVFVRNDQLTNIAANTEWQDGYEVRIGSDADVGTQWNNGLATLLTRIYTNSGLWQVSADDAGGTERVAAIFGAAAQELYAAGTKRFETTGTGATVTGDLAVTGTVDGRDVASDGGKLDGIDAGATAGATWGSDITGQPSVVSQAEAEAGTATTERIWTAERVGQAIAALGGAATDHGGLAGLGDDDHAQYALADGTRGNFEVQGAVTAHEGSYDHTDIHEQGTDQGLDTGGPNAVTAAQAKTAYDHSQTTTGNPHSLDAADVGADPAGTASAAVSTHESTYDHSDLHTQGTDQGLDTGGPNAVTAAQAKAAYDHSQVTTGNPHSLDAADVGADPSGTAASAVSTHEAAGDPHPGYQLESEKGAANGYAPLDASGLVLFSDLPVGTGATEVAQGDHNHSGTYEPADATILKEADVDDTPVDAATTVPISSNWAYDHVAAADPHTGYQLESEKNSASGYAGLDGSSLLDPAQLPAMSTGAQGAVPATGSPSGKYLKDDGTWDTPSGGSSIAVIKAKGTATSSVSNTTADVTWDTPIISDSSLTITGADILVVTTGTYVFDVTVRTTSNNRTELFIHTYIDTGGGYVEDTDEIVSDYVARDTDQDTGAVSLHTVFELGAGERIKFVAEGDCDGTCVLMTPGTILRILKVA